MKRRLALAAICGFLVLPARTAFANSSFTYEGVLEAEDASGAFAGVNGTKTFTVEIDGVTGSTASPVSCLLYSETQTALLAEGRFSFKVGTGSASSLGVGERFAKIFEPRASIVGTSSCTFNAQDATARWVLRLRDATTSDVLGSVELTSAPRAFVADSLGGYAAADFLKLDPTSNLTQANVASLFSTTTYPKMTALLGGTSEMYVARGGGGVAVLAESDIPVLSTSGHVQGSALTGTIGGTTAISTSGDLSTSGTVSGRTLKIVNSSSAAVAVRASSTQTASYSLTLPEAAPTGTQYLQTDASGNLTWQAVPGSAGAVTGSAALANGKTWIGSSGGLAAETYLNISHVHSTVGAGSFLTGTSCGTGQALLYSAVTDTLSCGAIPLADGALGAPGLTFAAEPTTGLWRPGAGLVAVVSNGQENMRVGSAGVGIGTTAISSRLSVFDAPANPSSAAGALAATESVTLSASSVAPLTGISGTLQITSGSASATGSLVAGRFLATASGGSGSVSSLIGLLSSYGNQSTSSSVIANAYGLVIQPFYQGGAISSSYGIYLAAPTGSVIPTSQYGLYQASSSAANYFAGNIGIGTSAPADALHVVGKVRAQQICYIDGTNCKDLTTGWSGTGSVTSVGLTAAPSGVFTVTNSPVTSSGTIGLSLNAQAAGTVLAAPSGGGTPGFRTLFVSDLRSSVSGLFWQASTCGAGQALTYNSASDAVSCSTLSLSSSQVTGALGYTPFSAGGGSMSGGLALPDDGLAVGASQFYLRNGFAGLGTTSPEARLTLVGDSGSDGNGWRNSGIILKDTNSSIGRYFSVASRSGSFQIADETAGAIRFTIDSGGCVKSSTATLGTCFSDRRLKTDIRSFDLGLASLLKMRPKTFRYNGLAGQASSDEPQFGVIAQELEEAAPDLVERAQAKLHPQDTETTELRRVKYAALLYVVINAVKDLYREWIDDSQTIHRELASKAERAEMDGISVENAELKSRMRELESDNAAMRAYLCAKDAAAAFCR